MFAVYDSRNKCEYAISDSRDHVAYICMLMNEAAGYGRYIIVER